MTNQAGKEEYYIRASEEEAMEVECLLVEPQTDHASVDGVFLFPKESLECTEIIHVSCGFGGQDTNAAGEGKAISELKAGKEEYYICASEEEAMEVECLLVEPQTDHASVDGVFLFPKESLECTEIIHVSCGFGGQDTNAAGEVKDISELKVLDVLPHEVEVGNFQAANGLSTACEDYIIDTEFIGSVAYLDYGSNDGLHLDNSGVVTQIPGFASDNNGTFGTSTTLTENVTVSGCRINIFDKTSLHCSFSCKCEPETSDEVKSLNCSTSSEWLNVDKLEGGPNLLLRGLSSDKNEKDAFSPPDFSSDGTSCSSRSIENKESKPVCQGEEIESCHGQDVLTKTSSQESNIGTFLTQKRSRKPTRRYIDESSNHSSRHRRKRIEIPSSASKDKILGVQCLRRRRSMGSKEKMSADEPFGKAIQVPFDSQAPTECPKKQSSILMANSREEFSPAASEDEPEETVRSAGGSAQRKLHKLWTISEVRKLIDGVSCCGVGRWTEIKKSLFSSSVHRTPVDLKDKWRNLLKAASCAVKQSKREDEHKRNQPWRPLPKSVLCRVRKLAVAYPYPREAKSKISKSKLSVHHVFVT